MSVQLGIVLSHTDMGAGKFCTNIAVQDPQTGVWTQRRPRLSPNLPLQLTSFGYDVPTMRAHWQPGAQVDIDWTGAATPGRVTHPEDHLFQAGGSTLYGTKLTAPQFRQLAQQFQAPSLRVLFPPMMGYRSGKQYVEDGHTLAQSVGYVMCDNVMLVTSTDAEVLTKAGESFKVVVKDTDVLARPVGTVYANVLVRFSIANAWGGKAPYTYSPERCYLMLSHIVP